MKLLRILINHENISLEPSSYKSDSTFGTLILKNMVCQSLIKLDATMTFQPDLATAWTISPDHRIFTFDLAPEVRFHDGTVLDAEKVVWNFQRLFDSLADSVLAKDFEGLEEVRALSVDRVEFRFAEPCMHFLHALAWRTHITNDRLTQPIGTGPFRVVEWIRKSHIRLRRFEDYWEPGLPTVDEAIICWTPDPQERVAMIERGEVDFVESVPPGAAARLQEKGLIETAAVSSPRKTAIIFNTQEPPFNDIRMRYAVAHAVDRERLIEELFGGRGRMVNGVLPADDPWAVKLEAPALDLDRARELVKEAGYAKGIKVKVDITAVPPVPKAAQFVAETLARIGIDLDIRKYTDPPWWPYLYLEGHRHMAFQGTSARPHPYLLFARDLVTDGPFNMGGYSNLKMDELVSESRRTIDEQKQRNLYAEAQRLVHADLPILPLWAADVYCGWRPALKGFYPHPLGYLDFARIIEE